MRKLPGALLLLFLCPHIARAADSLAVDAKRRHDELLQQGFNLTHGMSVAPQVQRIEMSVPPSKNEEHIISLWFEATRGEISVRFIGPSGDVLAAWTAKSGEHRMVRTLAPGKYTIEAGGAPGRGLVGVKGPIVSRCLLDTARVSEHAAEPDKGFHWPYLLVTPITPSATTLLVLPNNTGFVTEDLDLLRASATCQLGHETTMADRLGTAVLMPLFPRPAAAGTDENLYLHALSRAALETRTARYARVDLQLVAMIDHARALLGHQFKPRVLIAGFSASGSFANRFAVLHPDRVLGAAVGSPGGWPIAPVADPELTYPVGIADVAKLGGAEPDLAALRKVEFFFFLGADDKNDSVPYRDSFSATDEALILRRFGKTLVERWEAAKRLYAQTGMRTTFKLYPGVAHEVTLQMSADLEAVFRKLLLQEHAAGERRR
jgi:pimeloyl-ACP methyl ester carboxylesterase